MAYIYKQTEPWWGNKSAGNDLFNKIINYSDLFDCCVLFVKVNANGSVMSSDIVGSIKLKTMLSGMPELRLGLNDRVLFALTGRTCAAPA